MVATLVGQEPSLLLVSREGRRPIAISTIADQEYVLLDDLAQALQLSLVEESDTVAVAYNNQTIELTAGLAVASFSGRTVALSARTLHSGSRWLVPLDFIPRALAAIYDLRLDLRRPSRLVVVGDVRVPHVTVRHDPSPAAARVTIDATPKAASTVSQDGSRLTVRFDADALDMTLAPIQSQGIVTGIRSVDNVTLGIDLGPRFASFRTTTETIDATTRLVIELSAVPAQTDAAVAPALPSATPQGPELLPRPASPSPLGVIVLDPGHGGDEPGVTGPGGTIEKDLTLAVARRLKTALEARLAVRVILTREDDRSVPLDERTAVANTARASLFISLHANASVRPASGAIIYTASFGDLDPARALPSPERLPVFGGGTRDVALVPWNLAQLRFLRPSNAIAELLEAEIRRQVPQSAPQVSSAPLRVLTSAAMPALLIELGYLSNPDDEHQLTGGEFQTELAVAVVEMATRFRDMTAAAGGQP